MSWSSGTNTIKEGDESKSLTLQMLELKKQGGGTELFVRKNDVKLGTKSVTQNGTYTAAADDKYGFSQFSVNVRGGNGSADSHGKPTGGDIKPGGAGSAVVGTDPETGNDVVVGVDEDGQLVNTPLPSSIVLVTPPAKTDYNDGESIDLSGAVVVAKMADGSTWTDADHPNGHVSCTPEPAAADKSQATQDSSATSEFVTQPVAFGAPPIVESRTNSERKDYLTGGQIAFVVHNGSSRYMAVASKLSFDCERWEDWHDDGSKNNYREYSAGAKQFNGYQFYMYGTSSGWNDSRTYSVPVNETSDNTTAMAWTALFGEIQQGGKQTITLNWARPGDGKVLSTTMEINVGAHTTESSSGTEGSGGGGTF